MRFTFLTPYIFNTSDSVEVVRKKLEEITEEKRLFNSLRSNKKYQGEISKNTFRISRIISYQNSFLPIIHGKFHETAEGTELQMKFLPHWLVVAFFIGWIFGFFGLNYSSMMRGNFDLFDIFSVFFVVVFTGLFPLFIHLEKKNTEEYFNRIFNKKTLSSR